MSTARKRALPLVILPERRLPPLCRLPGQTPAKACQVLGRRKARHLTADFRQNRRSSNRLDARDAQEQLHRLHKGAQPLIDLQLQVVDAVFQEAHMGKDAPEQHPVMGLNLSIERLLQLGQFAAQGATSQLRQRFGIADPLDHGRYHALSALAHHKTSHRG
jgi:hypothetical protein